MAKLHNANQAMIEGVYQELASKSGLSVALSSHREEIARGMQAVVAVVDRVPASFEELNEAFIRLTDGKAAIVEGSVIFQPVGAQGDALAARFIAVSNVESQPYNEESVKSMKLVTANVFIEGDKVWNLVEDGADKRLVQSQPDDLDEILQSRRRHMGIAHLADCTSFNVENGDYVAYVRDDGSYRLGTGFALKTEAGLKVADLASGKDVQISVAQVTESIDGRCLTTEVSKDGKLETIKLGMKDRVEGNLTSEEADRVLGYFRRIYGDHPAFFNKLSDLIRSWQGKTQELFTSPQLNTTITGR